MKTRMAIIVLSAGLGVVTGVPARAGNLTPETYIELSIARLEFARAYWENHDRGPGAGELSLLWQRYGTTASRYLGFRSAHRKEVASYLAANPALAARIEQLAAQIDTLIAEKEPK